MGYEEVPVDNTAVEEAGLADSHIVVEVEDSLHTVVVMVVCKARQQVSNTGASLEPTTDSTVGAGTAGKEDHIHHRYNPHLDIPTCWSLRRNRLRNAD
jgi:hypothetical protein